MKTTTFDSYTRDRLNRLAANHGLYVRHADGSFAFRPSALKFHRDGFVSAYIFEDGKNRWQRLDGMHADNPGSGDRYEFPAAPAETPAPVAIKHAAVGSIISATLRTEDLFPAFVTELEYQQTRNGAFLSCPENFPLRDAIANILGECQDAYLDDGETLDPEQEDDISEWVNESLPDMLSTFAPPYCSFGSHPGDGSDFGFWPSLEEIDELPTVGDSDEAAELGEDCKSVNDHGNVTVYAGDGTVVLELV